MMNPHMPSPGAVAPTCALDAHVLGSLLLTLYQGARDHAVEAFQQLVVTTLSAHIAFDSSWWATAARLEGHDLVFGSHLSGAPSDLPSLANRIQGEDLVRRQINRHPNETLIFNTKQLCSTPGSEAIATHAGIAQMMSASSFSPVTNLLSFFLIARRRADPAFTDAERALLGLLMPHLTAMLHISRVAEISRPRNEDAALRSSTGAADGLGILHATEPGFAELLRSEWPAWSGPCLPQPVLQAIAGGHTHVPAQRIGIELSRVREHLLVTVSRRSAREALTPQEKTVSEAFAAGRSYKEVARELQLAPATVRHYLRSVYAKIGVSDKAALAQAIARY